MTWYIDKGPDSNVVLSSRIRLARNLANYPFPHLLTNMQAEQIEKLVTSTLTTYGKLVDNEFLRVEMDDMTESDKLSLVEKHLISEELTKGGIAKAAMILKDESVSVMINEEDHIRIQSMAAGFDLEKAFTRAKNISIYLEKSLNIGFNNKFGFTTSCPTNTGTGLRASVMAHLPGMAMVGKIATVIENIQKMGCSVRGFYGENSNSIGNIYQISNQITMGLSEEELISDLVKLIKQLIEQEMAIRIQLNKKTPINIEDIVYRSLATLESARMITTNEAIKLISDVRLGLSLGIIDSPDETKLNKIMAIVGPASVQKSAGRIMEPSERDAKRAQLVRDILKGGEDL